MSTTFEDNKGQIMVGEPAGGHGGGATSFVTRPATTHEITRHRESMIRKAEAAVLAAEQHLEAMKVAHAEHMKSMEPPVVDEETPRVNQEAAEEATRAHEQEV